MTGPKIYLAVILVQRVTLGDNKNLKFLLSLLNTARVIEKRYPGAFNCCMSRKKNSWSTFLTHNTGA